MLGGQRRVGVLNGDFLVGTVSYKPKLKASLIDDCDGQAHAKWEVRRLFAALCKTEDTARLLRLSRGANEQVFTCYGLEYDDCVDESWTAYLARHKGSANDLPSSLEQEWTVNTRGVRRNFLSNSPSQWAP